MGGEKDGGAHADSQNHQTYEASDGHVGRSAWPGSQSAGTVPPQHLWALRRFALEILASDELVQLATLNAINPDPTHVYSTVSNPERIQWRIGLLTSIRTT
jgi:hypothetical protein